MRFRHANVVSVTRIGRARVGAYLAPRASKLEALRTGARSLPSDNLTLPAPAAIDPGARLVGYTSQALGVKASVARTPSTSVHLDARALPGARHPITR